MAPDTRRIAADLLQSVPFARTLGVEFVEVTSDGAGGITAVLRLPDSAATHNHVGGPHAGALFTLGETASGAVVMAAFGQLLERAAPLTTRAEVRYQRLALGAVWATARLGRPATEVVAEFEAGARPEFPVSVEVGTEDGTVTTEMTVHWTLKRR